MSKVKSSKKSSTKKINLVQKQGNIGETHQVTNDPVATLTTQQGVPVADDQNTLRVTSRGPGLLEDFHLREKLFHFDHERIPERVVHARGYGAHGYFENYECLSSITSADIFQRKGEKTPAFVRFSTVAGNKGSADMVRDVRGFAVKLYTKQGNWDLVGNNIPVFFIQDAIKFPDLIHAAKDEPDSGFPQGATAHDNFWDFVSLMPESMHMVMWAMSDRGIPRSYRFMEGFGVHSFRLINAKGKSIFVKFHWKPKLGLQSIVWNEALKINGADPDFHRRDLWNAIKNGNYPEWELGLQLIDEKFMAKFPFDILDPTKLIPEEDVPVKIVGRLVLDRCVDNFFAETEQVAFCTQNIVPGIDFSNDPLLQGRNFSYLDTQLSRLGSTNFTYLPINAPKCPFNFFQQDGHMAMQNPKGRVNYEPNSWGTGPRENHEIGFKSYPEELSGQKIRERSETFADHYSQARQFYISQTPIEQHHLSSALIFELSKVEKLAIRERVVGHLLNIDKELAEKVSKGLRLTSKPQAIKPARVVNKNLKKSPTLSILENGPQSFAGRKMAVILTDGSDATLYDSLLKLSRKQKFDLEFIAPEVGGVKLSNNVLVPAQQNIQGAPSVLYDAIVLLPSDKGAKQLMHESVVRDFISDAFNHFKFIAYVSSAKPLLQRAGILEELDRGCVELDKKNALDKFIEQCSELRYWQREIDQLSRNAV